MRLAEQIWNRTFPAITDWHIYPWYNNVTLEHDLALVRLKQPCHQNPVKLPPEELNDDDEIKVVPLMTAGFGWTDKNEIGLLKRAEVKWQPRENCVNKTSYLMTEYKICTKPEEVKGSAACLGDSGGPLYNPVHKDGPMLLWVFSNYYSPDVCENIQENWFMRVAKYTRWITLMMTIT